MAPALGLLASIIGGALSVLVVHELGHLGTALLLRRRARVHWRSLSVSADIEPERRWAQVAFFLAGPLANLLSGAWAFSVGGGGVLVGALHLLFGALNLLPAPRQTDGAALLRLLLPSNTRGGNARRGC